MTDSWDLVQAAQRGDMDAYGELWRRYHRPLTKTIAHKLPIRDFSTYNYLQQWDTARDIVDEAFTRGLKSLHTFTRPDYDVSVWFEKIAKNILLDLLKSHRYRYSITLDPVTMTALHGLLPHELSADASEPAIRNALAEEVRQAVAELRPAQRDVIDLYYFHDLPTTEIADQVGNTVLGVKALLVRARGALRNRLSRDLLEEVAA